MLLYLLLKWVHILAAITALGANITYGLWISRAAKDPQALPFVLHTVRILDSRIANPAYALLLVTGIALVIVAPWPWTTPWILVSLILYVTAFLLGILVYAPAFRRQIALAESPAGPGSPEYAAAARRSNILGIVVTLIVVAIVYLMVVKPPLWA